MNVLDVQLSALRWLDSLPFRGKGAAEHLNTGVRGEREALFELRRRGYTVVARRWTSGLAVGDVDLIAWHEDRLCFIEVKTRTARDNAPAESAVDDRKRRVIKALARVYLRRFPSKLREGIRVRFDVVSVYLLPAGVEIEVFPGAFGAD